MIGALLTWLILAILVGIYAGNRGHSGFGMFVVSILLSPLIGFFIEALRNPNAAKTEAAVLSSGEMKKCPACAELIKAEARKCRYCGEAVEIQKSESQQVQMLEHKKCPDCAELVSIATTACTNCGRPLPDELFPALIEDRRRNSAQTQAQYNEAFNISQALTRPPGSSRTS